jgi:hypothetical protein
MELSIGTLPSHHHFLLIIRPLTDWVFKFITWLIIAATLWLGWERTGNWYLLTAAAITGLLPGAFIYSLLQWLSKLERPKKPGVPGPGSFIRVTKLQRLWMKCRAWIVATASLVAWWMLMLASQAAVSHVAFAILELQKSTMK